MQFLSYQPSQTAHIISLFKKTFTDSEGAEEGKAIGQLVESLFSTTPSDELYCFVAQEGDAILAAVVFTAFRDESNTQAVLLSPMAVATKHQGKKVGQGLITFALEQMKAQGYTVALTYGDPSFYSKVGFTQVNTDQVPAPQPLSYPHGWIAQSLVGGEIQLIGKTTCAPALDKPDFW